MPTRSKTLFSKFGHRQELRQTVIPPYEKCVSVELVHYLDLHSLMPPLQSGFRQFHSTESLMVSLPADILHGGPLSYHSTLPLIPLGSRGFCSFRSYPLSLCSLILWPTP